MKMIIDGKRYDTKTAEKLHAWSNKRGLQKRADGHTETLYRTKKGTFFIHGKSGPEGPYGSREIRGHKLTGSTILHLTPEKAFEWLTTHNGEEIAEKLFPDMIEDA